MFKRDKGFTLIEVLVVIGLLSILAAIVIVAINPARQFAQANNVQRRADVNTILNAVGQFMAENNGAVPTSISALADDTDGNVCTTAACTGVTVLPVDLYTDLVDLFIVGIPFDPTVASGEDSGYDIRHSVTNRITVTAPGAELGVVISVSR